MRARFTPGDLDAGELLRICLAPAAVIAGGVI
jgi:hypothetical protein